MPLVSQETANLIDTLATAAAKIGSTPASGKINQLIVDILPATAEEKNDADIAEAFRLDNIALQEEVTALVANDKVKQGNLDLARSQLQKIADVMLAVEGTEPPFISEIRDILSVALSPINV